MLNLYLVFRVLAHSNTCAILNWERAKRARHYQGCTNSSWCGVYIYIYIYMEVRMP